MAPLRRAECGVRRRQNFTLEEETAVLKPFLEQAREGGILVIGQIKHDLEKTLGHPMTLSFVYSLLHRHDWRKLAPDKRHLQSDPVAQDEWKKTPRNAPKPLQRLARTCWPEMPMLDERPWLPMGIHL